MKDSIYKSVRQMLVPADSALLDRIRQNKERLEQKRACAERSRSKGNVVALEPRQSMPGFSAGDTAEI